MNKIRLFFVSLFLLLHSQAYAVAWEFDPAHSNVYFDIQHIFSTIRGQFNNFSGSLIFDPNNLPASKLDFEVDVNSINTNIGKRDTHLRSGDFFNAGKYPAIKFKTTRITPAGGDKYLVEGKLTVKDVTRDLALTFAYHAPKDHPAVKGQVVAGLDSRFSINRLDFHVGDGKFYEMGVVGKDVDILLSIEMVRNQ